jgi:hypothetical protein
MNKQTLLSEARVVLLQKQTDLQTMMDDLNQGLADDTKSSAGDKYETSRAMSQQELDKIGVQLKEISRQLALLPQLEEQSQRQHSTVIQNGSLVETDSGLFFIGLPLGQLTVEGNTVFCLSPTAPIAQRLFGLKTGESCELNGRRYLVAGIG